MVRRIAFLLVFFLPVAPAMAHVSDFDCLFIALGTTPDNEPLWVDSWQFFDSTLTDVANDAVGTSYWLIKFDDDNPKPLSLLQAVDSQGREPWHFVLNHWAKKLAVDAEGNVLVAGSFLPSDYCFLLMKITADGEQLWRSDYAFEDAWWTATYDLRTDADGAVYATGTLQSDDEGRDSDKDIPLIKFDADGRFQWAKLYRPDGEFNSGRRLAIDNAGNAIVAGVSRTTAYDHFLIVLKYSPAGDLLWTAQEPLAQGFGEYAYGIFPQALAVNELDDLYLTVSDGTAATGQKALLIKYSSEGVRQWAATIDEPGDDSAAAIAIDSFGDLIVAGYCGPADDPQNIMLAKYNADGERQWYRCLPGDFPGTKESLNTVLVDDEDTIFVSGTGFTIDPEEELIEPALLLSRFTSSGEMVWFLPLGVNLNYTVAQSRALAFTNEGDLVLNGYAYWSPDPLDDDDDTVDDDAADDDAADDDSADDDSAGDDDDDNNNDDNDNGCGC